MLFFPGWQVRACCYDVVFVSKSQSNINVAYSQKITMSKILLPEPTISSFSGLYMGKETVSLVRRFSKKHNILVSMTPTQIEDAMLAVRENIIIVEDLYDSGLLVDTHIKNIIRKSIVECHFQKKTQS